jgi:hypothetical protein
LGAWLYARVAGPRQLANLAVAIPLREAAAGRRAEYKSGKTPHEASILSGISQRFPCGPGSIRELNWSELSRQVAVDLKADADFNEGRGGPSHEFLLRLAASTHCGCGLKLAD